MVQATPATSGGANSGRMLAAAMKRLNGVLVRTTIQENASPITTAIKVPPPHATSVLNSASPTFGLLEHGEEVGDREMGQAEALDHRIGVGERAEQQRENRINDQKGQDREQQQHPRRRQDTAASTGICLLHRALQRRCQLGQSVPLRRRLVLFLPVGIIPHDRRAVCNYFNQAVVGSLASWCQISSRRRISDMALTRA